MGRISNKPQSEEDAIYNYAVFLRQCGEVDESRRAMNQLRDLRKAKEKEAAEAERLALERKEAGRERLFRIVSAAAPVFWWVAVVVGLIWYAFFAGRELP